MGDKEFKSLDEYSDEFKKSGEKNFYEFLARKKQEALEAGEQELVEHIEKIYNEAYEEEQVYYMDLAEERQREEEEKRRRQEEMEANDYDESDYYETYLRSWIEGYKKEECLMVGDSLRHDIIPATELGIPCIWVTDEKNKEYKTIKDVYQLKKIL